MSGKDTDHYDFIEGDDEQQSSIGVVCPHCGHMHRDDLHGMTDGTQDFDCENCGTTFDAWADVSVTYYSEKQSP